jgi:putative DNA methylase
VDSSRKQSLLDVAGLPVEDLAVLCAREGRRPRPIYGAHRWFARRFGTAFRALLTAAAVPTGADFWTAYYEGTDLLRRWTVLDPFVGGGTSLFEATRLGADVVGVDVDAVACAITNFEVRAAVMPDLGPTLDNLKENVGEALAPYYETTTPEGEGGQVLHYFWVQLVRCRACGEEVEAHPHYQLAYESEGERQWAFCPVCHEVQVLDRSEAYLDCGKCGTISDVEGGPVNYGRFTCPSCGERERLIDVAPREGCHPRWRLFALETLESSPDGKNVPLSERRFIPLRLASLRRTRGE